MGKNKQNSAKNAYGEGTSFPATLARWTYYLLWGVAAFLLILVMFSGYFSFPYDGRN